MSLGLCLPCRWVGLEVGEGMPNPPPFSRRTKDVFLVITGLGEGSMPCRDEGREAFRAAIVSGGWEGIHDCAWSCCPFPQYQSINNAVRIDLRSFDKGTCHT